MARIRYMAVLSQDPSALAAFYTRHFGMKQLARSDAGDISLSDGGYNLTLFKQRPDLREPHKEDGYHHIGIAVDNLAEVEARYRKLYPRGTVARENGGPHHGELRIYDPECNPISLSQNNFGLGSSEPCQFPRIAHIALNALDPQAVRDFYAEIFGFRDLVIAHADMMQRPGYRNHHVGDGHTNVAIQAFYNDREGFEPRFGIAHMGFLVQDMDGLSARISDSATLIKRPGERVQSEIRMRDPQGNGCDLSRRGWEVDIDKWARAEVA